MTDFPVAIEDRWFRGPVSHPYPGVSSCRTDSALAGNPRVPSPACRTARRSPARQHRPADHRRRPAAPSRGSRPTTSRSSGSRSPRTTRRPRYTGLQDTLGVHMQALPPGRHPLHGLLVRAVGRPGVQHQDAHGHAARQRVPGLRPDRCRDTSDRIKCTPNPDGTHEDDGSGTGTWTCTLLFDPVGSDTRTLPDSLVQHMRSQIRNDAAGWDDPTCSELGCGFQAESEPTDLSKIRGNYTHDDTDVRGGTVQTPGVRRQARLQADRHDLDGQRLQRLHRDVPRLHEPRPLPQGAHRLGPALERLLRDAPDADGPRAEGRRRSRARRSTARPTSRRPTRRAAAIIAKEIADQAIEEAQASRPSPRRRGAGVAAYDATLPDDGAGDAPITRQPQDIERFDAATFEWVGGNNYTDNPDRHRPAQGRRRSGRRSPTRAARCPSRSPTRPARPGSTRARRAPSPAASSTTAPAARCGSGRRRSRPSSRGSRSSIRRGRPTRRPRRGPTASSCTASGARAARTPTTSARPTSSRCCRGAASPSRTRRSTAQGHVTFDAGPTATIEERLVEQGDGDRATARPPLAAENAPIPFEIGPINFPDTLKDPAATGALFLKPDRGYSGTSLTEVEHYCLNCSFRPWLDAAGASTATVEITRLKGGPKRETLKPDAAGRFVSKNTLKPGDTAKVTLQDAWGNRTAAPVVVSVANGSTAGGLAVTG